MAVQIDPRDLYAEAYRYFASNPALLMLEPDAAATQAIAAILRRHPETINFAAGDFLDAAGSATRQLRDEIRRVKAEADRIIRDPRP